MLRASLLIVVWILTSCSAPDYAATGPDPTTAKVYGGGLAGQEIDEATWDRAVAHVVAATVKVRVQGCRWRATGTGIAIDDNLVLTNRHVVQGARETRIETSKGRLVPVSTSRVSTSEDLALLELPSSVFDRPVRVSAGPTVSGDLAMVMGFPLGGEFTVGRGRIIGVRDTGRSVADEIEASVEVLPGNSGGPLLNAEGELIGVIRAIDLEGGSALAIPASEVTALLQDGADTRTKSCRTP